MDIRTCFNSLEDDLLTFAQNLVHIRSYSGDERNLALYIREEMEKLGYLVSIDAMGNVIGQLGEKGKSILLDAHMDTVAVHDAAEWQHDPFSGEIIDGYLYGCGSVDMKAALASAVYGGALAYRLGWIQDKTVYVTCTVDEEYCDGENLKYIFQDRALRPDFAVICEPSSNKIAIGHKGKGQFIIRTKGVSAHGSAPEEGINAVYEMAEIITRVDALNHRLSAIGNEHGTIVLSNISCTTASLNAVPSECKIYLDRRIAPWEDMDEIQKELDSLIEGKNASWEVGELRRSSWTGYNIHYIPFHAGWKIDQSHPFVKTAAEAYETTFSIRPASYLFWNFGTNGTTPAIMGIPTIGFGPGDPMQAHMVDEKCDLGQIKDACRFYAELIRYV